MRCSGCTAAPRKDSTPISSTIATQAIRRIRAIEPGKVEGERWDKERLREAMRPAIEFQREFNGHIHVGEFSAIRWAPDGSAFRYLRDCIDLFEEHE